MLVEFEKPLTVNQAAEILGCDASTVRAMCRTQALKSCSVGKGGGARNKTWRIMPQSVRDFQERGR